MIRAHFEHDVVLRLFGREKRERDTNVVVKTLWRHGAAEFGGEGSVNQVFCARFAVAASDGDDLAAKGFPHVRSQSSHRRSRIGDTHQMKSRNGRGGGFF